MFVEVLQESSGVLGVVGEEEEEDDDDGMVLRGC